jgi:hypothetical protein
MPDIYLTRTLTGLVPSDDEAKAACKRWHLGETLKCSVRKPRDSQNHRRYMGLLRLTFENQSKYQAFEHFRAAVQIKAGHCDVVEGIDGQQFYFQKSIAYDALDELEFSSNVMGPTMRVCAEILGGLDLDVLADEVARYAA